MQSRHFTGEQCGHCQGPQIGHSNVFEGKQRVPLCHPDYGMDCYHLVTVYRHSIPCDCRGEANHPDNDHCYRCGYRRFEHVVDVAEPQRKDFLGNPVPCWTFLEHPISAPF